MDIISFLTSWVIEKRVEIWVIIVKKIDVGKKSVHGPFGI
jgi:hypothetical protein